MTDRPTNQPTHFMELVASREVANSVLTQEHPSILWNAKVHYRVHNSTTPLAILTQMNQVLATPFCLSKIHLNIIHPLMY
jgi:hypothetical protein